MDDPAPRELTRLFATEIYTAQLTDAALAEHLDYACRKMARLDAQGRARSEKIGYLGYTSYGTVKELSTYAPVFEALKAFLDQHVLAYANMLQMDLAGKTLKIQDSWINVLEPKGGHANHFHALSVISGTYYVSAPEGSSPITFEDPRSGLMMHSPPRIAAAALERQAQVRVQPLPGTLILWESWLRHEVPVNLASEPRISISFNYDVV